MLSNLKSATNKNWKSTQGAWPPCFGLCFAENNFRKISAEHVCFKYAQVERLGGMGSSILLWHFFSPPSPKEHILFSKVDFYVLVMRIKDSEVVSWEGNKNLPWFPLSFGGKFQHPKVLWFFKKLCFMGSQFIIFLLVRFIRIFSWISY